MRDKEKASKKKLIFIGGLAVISIIYVFVGGLKNKEIENKNPNDIINSDTNYNNVESSNTVDTGDLLPSEGGAEKSIIWIKNLEFLSSKQTMDVVISLKTRLNSYLKVINKDIYEVNLIEDSYVENKNSFSINAKTEKIDGIIIIQFNDGAYDFSVKYNGDI